MLLDFLGFPRFSLAAAGVTAAADQRPGAWGVVDVMGVVGGLPRTLPRARGVVHLESSVFDRGKFNVYTPATRTRTVGFYFTSMAARGGRSGVWEVQKFLSIRMASCGSFLSPLFPSLLFHSPDLSRSFHTSPDLPDLSRSLQISPDLFSSLLGHLGFSPRASWPLKSLC